MARLHCCRNNQNRNAFLFSVYLFVGWIALDIVEGMNELFSSNYRYLQPDEEGRLKKTTNQDNIGDERSLVLGLDEDNDGEDNGLKLGWYKDKNMTRS